MKKHRGPFENLVDWR